MKRALVCGAGGFIGGHPSTGPLRLGPSTSSGGASGHASTGSGRGSAFFTLPILPGQALGGSKYVTVAELVQTVIAASGKKLRILYVEGPVGVHSRNFQKTRSQSLGWGAQVSLREGIARTCPWIEAEV